MISLMMEFAGEKILVIIQGKNITFGNSVFGSQVTTIDGLKFDYNGVCREFPDLETRKDWREEAIKRFKEKINTMETEKQIVEYIKEDLKKFGYTPLYIQREGFRIERIKK